ncbi:PAS domain S-box protein [Polynucleobacter sp. JS-Fieb-80-E5]|uniref:PAS domain S-box protein n=1 Tax=Polynucleobacter sp. JS-Fieb-80-E5 TaxID=2081050 RepID=UPI001C0D750A|nr:PAS domain S-box protein [Polynucleobacter sp. JS-Fieb-80-E5]MBU3617736.1 PAS domain S-box protein [Polynucleobacter sp. JS-Fieb-80-E5]
MTTDLSSTISIDPSQEALGRDAISRLLAIVNSSDDGILGLDLQGTITSWNPGAEKIFSYTPQEVIGQTMAFLMPANRLDEEDNILKKMLKGVTVNQLETERVGKGGHHIAVSIKACPVMSLDGKVIGFSKIIRDITTQKKEAQALIDVNNELIFQNEEKVKRAAELVIANEELTYQNNEKEKRLKELIFQNEEKAKRAAELVVANEELLHQNEEKAKRAAELVLASEEKAKRVHELVVANEELLYQNEEKVKRADELVIANEEKTKRVDELVIANFEKAKRSAELEASIKETHQTEYQMLTSLNALSLARDNETGNHVIRTQHYVRAIATRLFEMGKYPDQINRETIELMFNAAPLHDLGKVGIPDTILQKKREIDR